MSAYVGSSKNLKDLKGSGLAKTRNSTRSLPPFHSLPSQIPLAPFPLWPNHSLPWDYLAVRMCGRAVAELEVVARDGPITRLLANVNSSLITEFIEEVSPLLLYPCKFPGL